MPDLFHNATPDDLRARLRGAGWTPCGNNLLGRPLWRAPDDSHSCEEEQAFAWLARHERAKGGKDSAVS